MLTEGMEPYERFRYIVRKLLEVTIEDAQTYTLDERPSKAGTSRTKPRTK